MARVGLVLGAGGVVGAAFHEGVLRAINDATGWDPRTADIIVGTSAGSYVGARLRAGGQARDAIGERPGGAPGGAVDPPGSSRRAPAAIGALVRGVMRPGSARVGAMVAGVIPAGRHSMDSMIASVNRLHRRGWPAQPLWLPAVRLRDGARVVFGRQGAPATDLGHAVAASCAIPGYFTPITIDGERYVDGGAHSPTNLDLLADQELDLVVVVAPMGVARGVRSAAAAVQGRSYFRLRLGREAAAVRRGGARVVAFSPTAADLEVMGWNAMAFGRRAAVVKRAQESALRRLDDPRLAEDLDLLQQALGAARMTR
jgi:NTE family protein